MIVVLSRASSPRDCEVRHEHEASDISSAISFAQFSEIGFLFSDIDIFSTLGLSKLCVFALTSALGFSGIRRAIH